VFWNWPLRWPLEILEQIKFYRILCFQIFYYKNIYAAHVVLIIVNNIKKISNLKQIRSYCSSDASISVKGLCLFIQRQQKLYKEFYKYVQNIISG
jgi:hypothetical protein